MLYLIEFVLSSIFLYLVGGWLFEGIKIYMYRGKHVSPNTLMERIWRWCANER